MILKLQHQNPIYSKVKRHCTIKAYDLDFIFPYFIRNEKFKRKTNPKGYSEIRKTTAHRK